MNHNYQPWLTEMLVVKHNKWAGQHKTPSQDFYLPVDNNINNQVNWVGDLFRYHNQIHYIETNSVVFQYKIIFFDKLLLNMTRRYYQHMTLYF